MNVVGNEPSRGILKCLDDHFITFNTGQREAKGCFAMLPIPKTNWVFIYEDERIKNSSGITTHCVMVENIGNTYRFKDIEGRNFELEVTDGPIKKM